MFLTIICNKNIYLTIVNYFIPSVYRSFALRKCGEKEKEEGEAEKLEWVRESRMKLTSSIKFYKV